MANPKAPPGGFKQGGWYEGRQYFNGTFSQPGQIHPQSEQQGAGQQVSKEVIAQTAPENVAFIQGEIQSERIMADKIQAPTQIALPSSTPQGDFVTGVTAEVDQTKKALEDSIARQKSEADLKLAGLKEKEKETLDKVGTLVTPFREDLEKAERERLNINKNFEENQVLIDELDTLLTEGNELIRQQKEVTGLAAVRNPRIQKSMDDVAARTGVIEAVINARNGQISVAENMIDRSINAIVADRNDQISYYETILNLNRQDIISLDKQSQKLAEEQLAIKKGDLKRAEATADYVKQLLIDPATAGLMGEGGVKLTDSIGEINSKLTQATYAREVRDMSNEMTLEGAQAVVSPSGIPAKELRTLIDSRGNKHFFVVKEKARVGTVSDRTVAGASASISNQAINFADAVVSYANQLTLSEIYSAYNQSAMGQKWGRPSESSNEIALLYKWARGEITENEYRSALGG